MWHFEIIDEHNYEFLYYISITESLYNELKVSQEIKSDFDNFPDCLEKWLERCNSENLDISNNSASSPASYISYNIKIYLEENHMILIHNLNQFYILMIQNILLELFNIVLENDVYFFH